MIARIKVLGMRAASGAALRVAARGIVSYLQGGGGDRPAQRERLLDDTGPDAKRALAGAAAGPVAYYTAGEGGRSQGRARGQGAAAMGLVGLVSASQLEAVLLGCHAHTGEALLGANGAAGRRSQLPAGAQPVSRTGGRDEWLSLAEAAFLIGVEPRYLRDLAEHQPQTFFAAPAGVELVDPRLARRMIEWLCRVERTPPDKAYLLADQDPGSGPWRVRRGEVERFIEDRLVPETVMGFDLVCSAPKSVSLLWAVGDETMRAALAESFDAAVNATLAYLEQHACFGMVDGANRPGEGFAVASFVHDTSRANEAHLHLHNLIVNAIRVPVLDDVGRPVTDERGAPKVVWRAPDGDTLMRHVKTAGFLGAAELRHQLASRWGVQWGPVRNGVAELAAFPDALLRAFSTRHDQVAEEFASMVEAGFEPDGATEAAAQRSSRGPKTVLADDAVRAVQAQKLADLGWTPAAVRALVTGGPGAPETVTEADIDELHERLVGPLGLTERQTTFSSRDVHQAVAGWAGDRLSAGQIRGLAEAFVAEPAVVLCGAGERLRARQAPEAVYTTESMLAAEDNLLALYRQARVDHGAPPIAVVPAPVIAEAVAKVSAAVAAERDDPDGGLSAEQAELVAAVAGAGDGVRCAVGPAGTGKTEAMRAAVAAWQALGYRVVGCANGGAQTEQLGSRLGVDAEVVRSWLTRLEGADDPTGVWTENTVVVVDEATQVSTRDAEKLCRWAARTNTALVFVGDPAQLSSVGAGGWFRHVVYSDGAPSLSKIYRQQGDDMAAVRDALGGLRSQVPQRVRGAMDRLAVDGRVAVFDDADTLRNQVVDDWYRDRQDRLSATGKRPPKPSRMMASHRREVDWLNDAARVRLAVDGSLSGPELAVGARRFAVGDEVVTLTQAGHNLIPDGAPQDRYVRTGTVGVITAVHLDDEHPDRQCVRVDFAGRGPVTVDWRYLTHEFDDGRRGGLAHAYAITADRAQGSTMDTARAVTTDSTSRPAAYVMLSRGERQVRAYVTRDRDLDHRADDEQWLPVLTTPGGPLRAVVENLERSRAERLARDLDPVAHAAQQLRRGRPLAELSALAHAAQADPQGQAGGVRLIVARRAETAEQSAVAAAAVASAPAELVARLGGRPRHGQSRRAWDAAVGAVAVYRQRWSTGAGPAGYGQGARWAIGHRPADQNTSPWQKQRHQAETLVAQWADTLEPPTGQRFWAAIEHIPRQRATAGIHALIAAGVDPAELLDALSRREVGSAQTGAPILDHRVRNLLRSHHVDPAAYLLSDPLTQAAEWDRVRQLLDTAETRALKRRPVADLCAERCDLLGLAGGPADPALAAADDLAAARAGHDQTAARLADARCELAVEVDRRRPDPARIAARKHAVTGLERRHAAEALSIDLATQRQAPDGVEQRAGMRERHDLITAAIDLIVDDAMTAAAATRPAAYLTALLGERPAEPTGAGDWDRRARAVEAWRHHRLGLPYGQPAAAPSAPPSQQALGPPRADPIEEMSRRRLLERTQATLDLGAGR